VLGGWCLVVRVGVVVFSGAGWGGGV